MRLFFARPLASAGLILIGATACQTRVQPAPEPVVSTIFARNFGAYDMSVFVVPENGQPVWLTNVPAGATRDIPLVARYLRTGNGVVVRAQPLGGARSWTSGIAKLDEEVTGVLDLTTDRAGNPGGTLLRVVNTAVFESEMR